jgi:2-phospho-L-lactate/phosphoenolpyruvate guanylyltransferase
MTLHIVVPCKSLAEGKSRLSPILGRSARKIICARFLSHTLEVALSLVPADRCHVVVGDKDADSIVSTSGAAVIADPGLGLNVALSAARDQIFHDSAEDLAILVLPIDLPFVDNGALCAFMGSKADVVIAPDRQGSGTNALFIRARALHRFAFRFGPGSFFQHHESAMAAGFMVAVHQDPRLSFDVDNPSDYRERQHGNGTSNDRRIRI